MSKAQNMDRSSLLPFTSNGEVIEERGGGLCDCFSDWNSCIWGYCCPCYLFGRTAQRAGVTHLVFPKANERDWNERTPRRRTLARSGSDCELMSTGWRGLYRERETKIEMLLDAIWTLCD